MLWRSYAVLECQDVLLGRALADTEPGKSTGVQELKDVIRAQTFEQQLRMEFTAQQLILI